jgi:single-stranded DNA-binding protein
MNSIILNGNIAGDVKVSETKDGARKAAFQLSTDGRDLALYFRCVCFGTPAGVAASLVDGDEVLITGRLVANTMTKGITLVIHSMEILSSNQPEPEPEPQAQAQ